MIYLTIISQCIRPVHDWELEEVSRFFELLYAQQIRHGGEDKICWTPLKRMNFEVKSYYKMRINLEPVDGPWKSIWKSKAPSRVVFFVWTAALGKILTMDNLCKKNIIVTEWCCMCKKSGESIVHLLLHCECQWIAQLSKLAVHTYSCPNLLPKLLLF
jgi:hypothetical protein